MNTLSATAAVGTTSSTARTLPNRKDAAPKDGSGDGQNRSSPEASLSSPESIRESVEAVIVAIILTVVFRTFLGENYQIPTGSMAPTLQGRHMDVACPECGYQYRTGASRDIDAGDYGQEVIGTTCPICRYPHDLDKQNDLNQRSFGGDRIIVNKVAYAFHDPRRWDVFVFKYPGDPKTNYIKRLVGLPGETLRIQHGDVFVRDPSTAQLPESEQKFRIARKPADKVAVMLQIVDDTYHFGQILRDVNWPSRWDAVSATSQHWRGEGDGVFRVEGAQEDSWLGYHHVVPRQVIADDWKDILANRSPNLTGYDGMLVTDYYEYNDSEVLERRRGGQSRTMMSPTAGWNWVGDLALEAEFEVVNQQGELLLDLVEGGIHHLCRIDVATGKATATLAPGTADQRKMPFHDETGRELDKVEADTPIRGPGRYSLRFANVDDQLHLWVNGELVSFRGGTQFESPAQLAPQWSEQEPGDLMPVRIGARGADLKVTRLRVLRDIYYIAASIQSTIPDMDYSSGIDEKTLVEVLSNPRLWAEWADLFRNRREARYTLGPDQFFPMGDNCPQSLDARLWSFVDSNGRLNPPPYVDRKLLIGKAVFLYWPHSWNLPKVPFMIPNFQRIGVIR